MGSAKITGLYIDALSIDHVLSALEKKDWEGKTVGVCAFVIHN